MRLSSMNEPRKTGKATPVFNSWELHLSLRGEKILGMFFLVL